MLFSIIPKETIENSNKEFFLFMRNRSLSLIMIFRKFCMVRNQGLNRKCIHNNSLLLLPSHCQIYRFTTETEARCPCLPPTPPFFFFFFFAAQPFPCIQCAFDDTTKSTAGTSPGHVPTHSCPNVHQLGLNLVIQVDVVN